MSNTVDLLDATLDDLEDLPEFKPFPPGAHRVAVTLAIKEVNSKSCVEVTLKVIETLELAEPTKDTVLNAGDSTNVLCFLDNEFGRGNLKLIATPIQEALGIEGTLRDVIEAANDVECIVVTSNDKEKKYTNIKQIEVV